MYSYVLHGLVDLLGVLVRPLDSLGPPWSRYIMARSCIKHSYSLSSCVVFIPLHGHGTNNIMPGGCIKPPQLLRQSLLALNGHDTSNMCGSFIKPSYSFCSVHCPGIAVVPAACTPAPSVEFTALALLGHVATNVMFGGFMNVLFVLKC